ncbi:MAG: choice-of-anchor D domain-containing protein [Acidobacteriota bacterium]
MRRQWVWWLVFCFAWLGALPVFGQIQFRDGSTVIPDGSVYDFGTTPVGVDLTKHITLVNVGSQPITISQARVVTNIFDPGRFSISNQDLGTLNPGDSGGFDATYSSTDAGTVTNEIGLLVNGVVAYRFDARATGEAPVGPVIQLKLGNTTIHRDDLVHFGTTALNVPVNRTFTVTNVGDQNLTIGSISFVGDAGNPVLFTAPTNNVQNVAPNHSATFSLRFSASQIGTVTNRVRLFVNGSSNFEFDVRGTANPPPAPNLEVRRSGATLGHTGSVNLGTTDFGGEILEDFTLVNNGNATLTVNSVTWSGGEVSFATSAPGSVPAGQSRSFTLRFSGDHEGPRSSLISVNTDDPSPNPYHFTVHWTVDDAAGPIIQVRHNGSTVPQASAFDFGDTGVGQQIVRTFTVTNAGDQPLTVSHISISRTINDPARFHVQNNTVANVQPGQSGTFELRFDAAAVGPVTSEIRLLEGGVPRYSFFAHGETKVPTYTLNVSPSSRTVQPGGSAVYTVTVNGQFGFDSNVSLSLSGQPSHTTHSFTPVTVSPGGSSTLRVNTTASTPLVSRTLTITGNGGGLTRTDTAQLVVQDGQDFMVNVSPSSRTVEPGGAATYTVSVYPVNGFDSAVALSLSGLPAGSSHTFTPVNVQPGHTSTLRVTTSGSTPLGARTLTVTGTGGGRTRTDTAQLVVDDDPPAGAPVIDSVSPDTFVHGAIRTLTLTGANFQGATVTVPQDPPDPDQPINRWFPTVTVESINAAGTQMVVQVDARDTRILDFYNLLVANGQGEEAAFFRVLPAGPLVDTWTPAEPERGESYVLSLVGHNLRHATVSPSHSGRVHIFGVDNGRDDRLNAILQVLPGAPLGPIDLVVRDPSGHSVTLPITIHAAGGSALLRRDVIAEQDPDVRSETSAGPKPKLFFQDFVMRETQATVMSQENAIVLHPAMAPTGESHARTHLAPEEESMINFEIYFRVRFNLVNFHWQVGLTFDPDTGQIGDAVLQGLNVGDRVDIGAFVLSFYLKVDLTVYFRFGTQGWSFPLFCLEITTGLEIPGRAGFAYSIDFCRGGSGGNFTSGNTGSLEVTGGPCAEVTQQGPPAEGLVFAEVEQDDCCDQPIGLSGSGSTFTGFPFGLPNWNVENPNAASTTAGPVCSPPICNVSISNPPACISKNRMRTYTASGAPGGGSYRWRITQGGSKASIEGATNQNNVSVKGNANSSAADDVELEVTYTVNGASCTKSVDLSVIEVNQVWRGSGMLDPMFNVPGDATQFGLPTLGPVTPNNPPGTNGWYKNMQIKGTVTPCDPNLRCDFNFKRNRVGTVGTRRMVNGVPIFQPLSVDCPQGGCDDDAHDTDEDLVLDGPRGCGLFVLDVPGVQRPTCSPARNTLEVIHCLSFDEWLNVDGERGSDIQLWYASTRIRCDGTSWSLNSQGQGNRLSTGVLDCSREAALPIIPSPVLVGEEGVFSVDEVIAGLKSRAEGDRMAAAADAVAWEASGTLTGGDRDKLIRKLYRMANREAENGVEFSSPLQAIRLLGALKATRAIVIHRLISRVEDEFPRPMVDSLSDITPAATALGQIGAPTVGPILDRAAVASESEWRQLTAALRLMEDPADLEDALQGRMMTAEGLEMKRLEELMSE